MEGAVSYDRGTSAFFTPWNVSLTSRKREEETRSGHLLRAKGRGSKTRVSPNLRLKDPQLKAQGPSRTCNESKEEEEEEERARGMLIEQVFHYSTPFRARKQIIHK